MRSTAPTTALSRSSRGAVTTVVVASVVLVAGSATVAANGAVRFEAVALAGAAVLWSVICTFAVRGMRNHPHEAFGAANAVTLARAVIIVAIAALIPIDTEAGHPAGAAAESDVQWFVAAAGLVALGLDAVDGALARAANLASAFGARFDVEVDSLLSLVLSVMIWRIDKLGPWILALGLLRYVFVAAGFLWPVLSGALPPSPRRRLVGVVQLAALAVIVSPPVSPVLAAPLGLAMLAATAISFAVDVRALLSRSGRRESGAR